MSVRALITSEGTPFIKRNKGCFSMVTMTDLTGHVIVKYKLTPFLTVALNKIP